MSDASTPSPVPGAAPQDGADAGTSAYLLLDLVRRLRGRERGTLAGWLHDGPIQDLAAVPLLLAEARRAMGASPDGATGASPDDALDVVARQVTEAGRLLRGLQNDLWPFPPPPSGLAQALNRRTAWLLTAPLAVDAGEGTAGLLEAEIVLLADLVELLLGGLFSAEPPDRALAAVRAAEDLIVLDLTMTAAPGTGEASAAELAAARAVLGSLAAAVGAGADVVRHGRRLRVRMDLPRRPPHRAGLGAGPAAALGARTQMSP
jgi:hypothetical protein